ncbi:FKBP-type peptidyl-prolyl cis-trans isomerase [Aurantibacillus circumpalustris]|uniref:FKBP-type peptidyl-prolyl cis-trans isomerase n=1 Tax=Aurantibacillus circumpalustris TaxID=3036359 RepID=UPI00295BC3FC|nr:FKBP-type peptidyl-prolyl cis-trans isomerase [Aurantibacillus circumpalustris]
MFRSFFNTLGFLVLLQTSCKEPSSNTNDKRVDNAHTDKVIKEQFIKANQQLMVKENDEMDYYAKSHKMPFQKTTSGIRFYVYKPSAKGDSIRDSMRVSINFEIKLLDGTLCYSSKTQGRRDFMIGHEDIESGIHKGLQYLKRGDKALLLIPSPLAHGLLGDFNKIPPQMPILCDIEVF